MAAAQDGGVGGKHAVHVGPDLDFLGANARAHDGRGEVRSAAAERGGDAIVRSADESAHHHHRARGQRRHGCGQAAVRLGEIGRGLRVAFVGDDDLARIQVHGGDAEMAKGVGDHEAREAFAVARNGVHRARGELAQHRQAFHQFGELLEMFVEKAVEGGAFRERRHLPGFARVVVAQVVKLADILVAPAFDGRRGDGQQLIGGLAHGGDYHHGMAVPPLVDDAGDAFDSGGRFHRRAAEFHDDHASIPSKREERVSPQRLRDAEEHLRKKADSEVDGVASSLGFESTEGAEDTECAARERLERLPVMAAAFLPNA